MSLTEAWWFWYTPRMLVEACIPSLSSLANARVSSEANIIGLMGRAEFTRREFLEKTGVVFLGFVLTSCAPSALEIGDAPTTEATRTTILPTPTLVPTQIPEVAILPTPELQRTVFEALLQPFINEALKRREDRALKDPEYFKRVDKELNEGRVNFLLFGYGETHEPPLVERAIIASPTIISIDYRNKKIDIISLTHDIRDPLVEEVLGIKGKPNSVQRLDQSLLNKEAAQKVGKFRLPQLSLENATSLSIDFQIHMSDNAIQRLVDDVIGGLVIDVPINEPLGAYYYKGVKYDDGGRVFKKGKVTLNGREAVGFIKAIAALGPKDKEYSPLMEHNVRKALFFEALKATLITQVDSLAFKAKLTAYVSNECFVTQEVAPDFNSIELVINNLSVVVSGLEKLNQNNKDLGTFPISQQLYAVDACCSSDPRNMPVHWATATIIDGEQKMREDIKNGVIPKGLGLEVPYGGDPYGDLVNYWRAVRLWVKKKLTN